jgi:hypothetical protein
MMETLAIAALLAVAVQYPQHPQGATQHHFRASRREWKQTVVIPPCGSGQNLQIIWPKHFAGTITIECDNLPAVK